MLQRFYSARASHAATVRRSASIEGLLRAAVQAPSGDNTQPWRSVVDQQVCRVDLFVDARPLCDCDPPHRFEAVLRDVERLGEQQKRATSCQG